LLSTIHLVFGISKTLFFTGIRKAILGPPHWTLAVIEGLLLLLTNFHLAELDWSLVEWANHFTASREGDLAHLLRIHPRVLAHLVSSNMSLAKWRSWWPTPPLHHRSTTPPIATGNGGEAIYKPLVRPEGCAHLRNRFSGLAHRKDCNFCDIT
jgi:hypothetical protein